MYKIITKKELTSNVKYFEVHAPAVAHKSKPGQFVIVRGKETGERLPITIAGTDPEKGTVDIYFAEVGKSSTELGLLDEGESILNFAGPLGNSVKIQDYGKILCVGGGVFVGAMLYQIEAFKEAGKPLRPGEAAELASVDKKDAEKAIKELVKEEKIFSPKRCFYEAT